MRVLACPRSCSSQFQSEARLSPRQAAPARWTLLLPLLLLGLGGGEARSAPGEEDGGPAKEQVEAVSLPIDREPGALHAGTPSPASAARPRGLTEALYRHVDLDLPALDAATIRAMRVQHGLSWTGPRRTLTGASGRPPPRSRSAAPGLLGAWGLTHANEPIWRLTIRSAEAAAIAVRFETFDVDGAVWVYTQAGDAHAGPYTGRGPRGNGQFWSVPIRADTVTVEYLPRRRESEGTQPPFRIPEISHHVRSEPRKPVESPLTPRHSQIPGSPERSSEGPYKNATCSLEWLRRGGHGQEELVNSVALALTPTETGGRHCSAVLLNNLRERDGTELPPHYAAVLTAGHCVRNDHEADATILIWKYRTAACDGPAPNLLAPENLTRGTRLWDRKWSESLLGKVEDYALLLVRRDELPDGVYSAGWTIRDVDRGDDVYTLGHPNLESLRLAVGDVDDLNEGTWLLYSPSFGVASDYGRVGVGAYGAPVFGRLTEDGQVVGILAGTSSS